ncbi:tRNA-dihydrouridine(20/20a) synthase [Zhongshania aliphaticivorans]|uniref:tRNA-dihydrouridine(20/20a) synthase n=1 Tax=Zhongshania aliphaticivorans TaxID=1470434 RepID=A0A5S9QPG3_9GAMM|nr:tRNA dihydrouridine(20/20a) synthase DusA [Zhongshania aliphaticivorans]CAA0088152.1 tRNA-dihydrouridine(20/20a) synthase [Zhongshania aliphaticivorans]CAA0116046.1 tRNA-dihydrouridine(20/20a) synthase [Zhongshania aliphaticivorans]CAA0120365.1 tRNA-dihydrouridine(20/20a) synthase [Zhongshania aliphaticivorans]
MHKKTLNRRFCVAPMLDWSDRHCRVFWRQLTTEAVLYTEMVTTGALLHGDVGRHLNFSDIEHPVALQLGGSDPAALASSVKLAEQWGYDEINLNCGCPSDRVQNGFFGACLMSRPSLVADCVKAMKDVTALPVTVKHRIGIDDQEGYGPLQDFVSAIYDAGTDAIIVHARKAWLQGLSPKENREIPPLNYDLVHKLKVDFPDLDVIINGGLQTIPEAASQLSYVDGIMMGRSAYQTPYLLAEVDQQFYGINRQVAARNQVVRDMFPYIESELALGTRLNHITRHLLGIFNGQPGGRLFRRYISEHAHRPNAGIEVLEHALTLAEQALLMMQEKRTLINE